MSRSHRYETTVTWTGNTGPGTSGYRDYQRTHEISADGSRRSSDPPTPPFAAIRPAGIPRSCSSRRCRSATCSRSCPCARAKASWSPTTATARREPCSKPPMAAVHFEEVVLRPAVPGPRHPRTRSAPPQLHERAHHLCFIASSVNFPVRCEPSEARIGRSFRSASSLREATPSFGYAL